MARKSRRDLIKVTTEFVEKFDELVRDFALKHGAILTTPVYKWNDVASVDIMLPYLASGKPRSMLFHLYAIPNDCPENLADLRVFVSTETPGALMGSTKCLDQLCHWGDALAWIGAKMVWFTPEALRADITDIYGQDFFDEYRPDRTIDFWSDLW